MYLRLFLVCLVTGGLSVFARAAERPLVVDFAQSRVEIAVKVTVDSFVSKLVRYDPQVAVGDDGRVVSARLAFHFPDVVTGKPGRDKAMHTWQQTEKYPDGVFVLTSIEPAEGGAHTALGRLTFHGVTKDLRFPVSFTREGERYAIDGDATVDTREFGLPIIRMMGVMKVDPLVHVRFHLQGAAEARTEGTR